MTIPKKLSKYNLVAPKSYPKRRLILTVEGSAGSGKTDLVLRTAPRRLDEDTGAKGILVVDLDHNSETVEDKYIEEDIVFNHVDIPYELDQPEDRKVLFGVRDLILDAIDNDIFRTVFIDTGSALYELARRAFYGSLDFADTPQSSYFILNSFFNKIYNAAKSKRVTLVVSHHQKEAGSTEMGKNGRKTWVRTGEMALRGWAHTLESTQCHVVMAVDPSKDGFSKFSMTVTKANANPMALGLEFIGEEISMSNLGMMIYPTTQETPEVWE